MFGKLKDKLKSALSVFSKKTEEEAEVEEKIVEVEQAISEKPVAESVPEPEVPILEEDVEIPVVEEVEEKVVAPVVSKIHIEEKIHQEKVEKTNIEKSIPIQQEKKTVQEKHHPASKVESKPVEKKVEPKETSKPTHKPTPVAKAEVQKHAEPIKSEPAVVKKEEHIEKSHQEQKGTHSTPTIIEPVQPEKKGFFGRLFSKKEETPKEEIKETPTIVTKEDVVEKKHEIHESIKTHHEEKKSEVILQKPEVKAEKPTKKEAIPQKAQEEPVDEQGFFGKLKQAITTKTISTDKFEELFWELELVLLENNVSVEVIERIKEDLKTELVDKPLPRDVLGKINDTLRSTVRDILTYDKVDLIAKVKQAKEQQKPYVVAFFGINGAGKTTSIAKLTAYFQKHKLSVVLAACDTFRAAAIQQLEEHATKLNVKIIKHDYGSDAAAVAFDAIKYAQKNNVDVVLIDTAGRLHSNTNLMAELEKIIRVTKPDLKVFVGESITGNDCIEQARSFNELVQMDGAILTKADVDEKGGAPLSISYVIKKPILFLGVGQKYGDFEEFDVEKMVMRLGL
ncbi:signal recognition particle-docking protein FtsY [Candidatus Woesearchaeota archaeon]|nr:signal recognition particle-docking protein FtsY [Candidatus Woesearchaeota archaeon]